MDYLPLRGIRKRNDGYMLSVSVGRNTRKRRTSPVFPRRETVSREMNRLRCVINLVINLRMSGSVYVVFERGVRARSARISLFSSTYSEDSLAIISIECFYFSRLRHRPTRGYAINRHDARTQVQHREAAGVLVRCVRAFSSRIFLSQCIFIISHFRVSITSEEYPSHRSLIPQDKRITRKATFECKRTKT